MRLQAAQAAVILLPDENREVLQTLLYFLSDIASAEENQMTAGNLALCLAPSILHLNISKKEGTSPRYVLVFVFLCMFSSWHVLICIGVCCLALRGRFRLKTVTLFLDIPFLCTSQ